MNLALRQYSEEEQWPSFANTASEFAPALARPVMVSRPQLSAPSTAVVHNSRWARPTIDRLMVLASLKDNWDQRGSTAPRADVLSFAWNILDRIMPYDGRVPVIVPLGNGGIQLEWSAPHADLEVEVTRPFQVSAVFYNDENETEVETETLNQLTQLLRQHFRP
jgi:hypothetical protein